MDRIQELLTRLADLSDAEIAELEGLILAEFDSVQAEEPTNVSVERMVSLADALDTVRTEVSTRNDQAEELAQKAAEATARVHADAEVSDDTPDASEMGMKDEDEEDDELPSEDQIAEDIEQVTEDVVEAVEDAEAAGEANEEEDEDKKKFSDDAPAEAELSVDTDEAPADAELTESDDETTEADAEVEAEVEAAAELSDDSETETETGNSTSTTELSDGSAEQSETPIDTSEQENAMTASIDQGDGVVVTPPADAAPVPSLTASGALNLAITAGADIPSYGTGAELSDMDQVADAFAKRLHTLRNVQGGSGSQYTIATLSYEFPEDRQLAGDDPMNITKVNKIVSPAALTAAAGICAPLETIYDVSICGDADRPIRDALARFNADRGGIEYYGAPTLGTCTGIWDPNTPAAKTCCDAACPTKQTVGLEAIYACLKFSNYTNRFFPEVIKANTDLAMINHARQAEMHLMNKIHAAAGTSVVTPSGGLTGVSAKTLAAGGVGVARQLIVTIHSAAAYLRRKHRLSANATMRVILPSWMEDALVADLALQMPGDGEDVLSIGKRRLTSILDSLGLRVTWSLDAWTDQGAAAAAPTVGNGGFDAKVSFPMFPEGSLLFLDGGTLDLGVQRDATMLGANEYATFVESFEGVAMTGCEVLWISGLDVCVSGAAAALVDTTC